MSATDELRKLLDERGVDWRRWSGNSKRKTQWFMPNSNIGSDMPGGYCVTVSEHKDGTLYFNSMIAAPEQAIAATLGERSKTNQNGVTAEQVMAIVGRYQPAYCPYTNGRFDWQGIADELNALSLNNQSMSESLSERGTCKNKATSLRTFWCDCCDCALEDWMDVGGKLINGLRYCPNCGRKVVDE